MQTRSRPQDGLEKRKRPRKTHRPTSPATKLLSPSKPFSETKGGLGGKRRITTGALRKTGSSYQSASKPTNKMHGCSQLRATNETGRLGKNRFSDHRFVSEVGLVMLRGFTQLSASRKGRTRNRRNGASDCPHGAEKCGVRRSVGPPLGGPPDRGRVVSAPPTTRLTKATGQKLTNASFEQDVVPA